MNTPNSKNTTPLDKCQPPDNGHTSYQPQKVFALIKSLTGQTNVLTIQRPFIQLTGDINTALLLSQLCYWQGRQRRDDGGIYKCYTEWTEEIGLSKYQVNRSAGILKELGLLTTKVRKVKGAPTIHYYLDLDSLTDALMRLAGNGRVPEMESKETSLSESKETSLSLTETTPENTYNSSSNDFKFLLDQGFRKDWVDRALQKASAPGVKNKLKYALGILRDWQANGGPEPASIPAAPDRTGQIDTDPEDFLDISKYKADVQAGKYVRRTVVQN